MLMCSNHERKTAYKTMLISRCTVSLAIILLVSSMTFAQGAEGQESKPLLRDIQAGYLLNYFFMSPRPYCWQKEDCLLSGWEVDRSGGMFEFSPNCHYPSGFAFHSDWFKLVDTSTNATITIKHQLARQTEGPLTLEFRFKLPAKMDGVHWQLRDLQEAGVSLITADGNLCCETGDGKAVVLQPVQVDREYGVKIIADITAKKADVYVDGQLKAQAMPFLHLIKTVDYVLIQTGGATTGEMFLNPVNVYKGYTVNETFVTSGVSIVPADWKVESGIVKVEEFECGTKPDIFSLKLKGDSDRPAVASKSFDLIAGKIVYEYRFLLPEKHDGATAELTNGEKSGLKIVTVDGNLCAVIAKDKFVLLVRDYRPNFWYMVKAIAEPKSGTADIYVNGKPAAKHVTLGYVGARFDSLRFASTAVMWIDDVQVYPWRDYPSDYVPEPKPCPAKSPYLLGVQSCNLWREGHAYAGWDYVYPFRTKREPYLGWYDEGNPEETDWEIKWQVEHGIGFELHCWYRPNNAINHPIKDGVLDQGIIKGLFNARYSHLKKFAIMCTNEGACETNPQDWRENIISYWIEYFFKDSRYLKIEGKPILSIYSIDNLQRMFGSVENCRKAIDVLREECKKSGFPGVVVLMEHRGADRKVLQTMKAIGVDYCYAYTWGTPDVNVQRNKNLEQRAAVAAVDFNMLPSISMGWDREAWGVHDGGWVSVRDYKTLAQWAKDEFMPSLPTDSLGRRVLMLANWNEFGEGHFLMPSALVGFGYVDALRDVFTDGDAHRDAVPTKQQKRRFNVLYPMDFTSDKTIPDN